MGLLVEGVWQDKWYDTGKSGRFERPSTQFRNWVTADGAPGPTGRGGFKAEAGRYHLYAALFCPWAHRTLIMRALKGLDEHVSVSITNWLMGENGLTFAPGRAVVPDPLMNASFLYEIYRAAAPDYTGRVSVPVLWDKQTATIVSNESADIIRMFDAAFAGVGAVGNEFYPAALRDEIDGYNARIYDSVNNGVYKAGFATTQAAYEEAVRPLFATLDWLDAHLQSRRYLCGDAMSEADIRLLTTLLRFDIVYVGHFKCNIRRIADYSALDAYVRDLYQTEGVAATFDPQHIKAHYYGSHPTINPTGIVPVGPAIDFMAPHARAALATR